MRAYPTSWLQAPVRADAREGGGGARRAYLDHGAAETRVGRGGRGDARTQEVVVRRLQRLQAEGVVAVALGKRGHSGAAAVAVQLHAHDAPGRLLLAVHPRDHDCKWREGHWGCCGSRMGCLRRSIHGSGRLLPV